MAFCFLLLSFFFSGSHQLHPTTTSLIFSCFTTQIFLVVHFFCHQFTFIFLSFMFQNMRPKSHIYIKMVFYFLWKTIIHHNKLFTIHNISIFSNFSILVYFLVYIQPRYTNSQMSTFSPAVTTVLGFDVSIFRSILLITSDHSMQILQIFSQQ